MQNGIFDLIMILFVFKLLSQIQVGITLSGENTAGSGQPAQPIGEHGYDDLQENWVEETNLFGLFR